MLKDFTMHKNGAQVSWRNNYELESSWQMWALFFWHCHCIGTKRLQGPNTWSKKHKPIARICFVLQTNQTNVMDWNIFENGNTNVVWHIPLRKQFIKSEINKKGMCKFLIIPGFTKLQNLRQCCSSVPVFFYIPRCNIQWSIYPTPRNLWF